MFDDLDDLLPKRQTSTALENPFEDVFSGGPTTSVDPWSAMGGSGAGGFGMVDDWNTNAFADHESPFKHPTTYDEPATPETHKTEGISTPTYEEPPTPTAAAMTRDDHVQPSPIVESGKPNAPIAAAVDPLDAAASNIEEEEVHIPVIRRKLPLLSSEPAPPPLPEITSGLPNEPLPPKPAEVKLEDSMPETETPPIEVPKSPPAASLSEEAPQTPTITHATPETTPPAGPSPPPSRTRDPSTPSSHSSAFSEQALSSSRQSSNIIVSPLETPSRSSITPLSSTYSGLPLGADAGRWGGDFGGWGGGSSLPSAYGTEETVATPSTETVSETETPSEASVKHAASTDDEDPSDNIPLAHALKPKQMYRITVGDPQKIGDPISAHIVYTVHTKTTNLNYHKSEFSVLRRYSDFVWIYETLCSNNPGVIVPPIPEKSSLNRFQDAFVENRRLALNKCIQKIANHPALCNDIDLKLFLESDSFALDVKHRRAEEGGGFLSALSTSITASKFYETDDWFDTKKAYLDGLETQLKGLVKAMETVAKQRAELSLGLGEFVETVEGLSGTDISNQLAGTLQNLATVQNKAKKLQDDQAQQDAVTFAGTVEEYGRMIQSVRVAFASRIKCYGQWQSAENDVRRVKSLGEKARRQGRNHAQDIADSERKATVARQEFEKVTRLLKVEMHRFDMERVEDFKKSLEALLEGMIMRQRQLIKAWESYQELLLQKGGTNPNPGISQAADSPDDSQTASVVG